MVQFRVFDLQNVARIVGAPKAATGLSEAREAAGATAELRIACFLVGLVYDSRFIVSEHK